jgi:hypothetical protein
MTDLTDFLNVAASAEDWAGFGADGREPEPIKRFTIDVPVELSSPDKDRLRPPRAKAVERAARFAGARIPRHVRAVSVAAVTDQFPCPTITIGQLISGPRRAGLRVSRAAWSWCRN